MGAVHKNFLVGSPKCSAAVNLAGAGLLDLFQRCVLLEDLMNTADFVWMALLLEVVPGVVAQEETDSFPVVMAMAMAREEQDSFPFLEATVSPQV